MNNGVVWFEVPFDDSERAKKFYQDTFGWQIDKVPDMDYFTSLTTESDPQTMQPKTPGTINGGMFKKDPTGNYPILVIGVDSIDEHIKKVENSGGKIVMPKIDVGQFGKYARVSDTEGNIIGLWQTMKQ